MSCKISKPTSCATLLSPRGPSLALRAIHLVSRLRRVTRMCSSKVSVNCEYFTKDTKRYPDCRSPFRSGRRSLVCARLSNKGKVGVQRGRETAGVPSFLPPRRAPRRSRRPQTANPPLRFSGKLSARQGRTRLRQFECTAGSVQRKVPPGQGEHADAVRAPRSAGAEKAAGMEM